MRQCKKPTRGRAFIACILLRVITVLDKLGKSSTRFKTINQQLKELAEKVLETKSIKVCVGKEKKPIDKDDEIIFHIDI